MTVIDHGLSLEEQCEAIWEATRAEERREQNQRQIHRLHCCGTARCGCSIWCRPSTAAPSI